MDEMDALRDFRSNQAGLDDETRIRIRGRLESLMNEEETSRQIVWCYGLLILALASAALGAYVAFEQSAASDRIMGAIVMVLALIAVPIIAAHNPHRHKKDVRQ